MSPEKSYLLFVQIAVTLNTLLLPLTIYLARKQKLSGHKALGAWISGSTLIGALGLVLTVLWGWDYVAATGVESWRLQLHRCFSTPLFLCLICVAYTGMRHMRKAHIYSVRALYPFWLGTLVTGWWFF